MKLLLTTISLLTCFSAHAENVRLIATPSEPVSQQSTGQHKVIYNTFSVPEEKAQERIRELMDTGLYRAVEIDMVTSSITVSATLADSAPKYYPPFSDPAYGYQTYLMSSSEHMTGMGATEAQSYLIPYRPMTVGVIDSEFEDIMDIPFTNGISMVEGEDDVWEPACAGRHGVMVYSLIASSRNNGVGMAGMTDVDIVPVRAMTCGSGYSSHSANGIYYLSGAEVNGVPGLEEPVSVINMSLGGEHPCSVHTQSAINYATSKGITVVVSAGNEAIDASRVSPANCEGVISVGALAEGDSRMELSYFSNFGDTVDVSAMGSDVFALYNDDTAYLVSGTSFSAPLTSGVVTMARQLLPEESPDMIKWLVKRTATPFPDGHDCLSVGCGSGITNALALTQQADRISQSGYGTIAPLLKNPRFCDSDKAYALNNEALPQICGIYELSLNVNLREGEKGVVYHRVSGEITRVSETRSGKSRIDKPEEDGDYLFKVCDSEENCSPAMPINIDTDIPEICQ